MLYTYTGNGGVAPIFEVEYVPSSPSLLNTKHKFGPVTCTLNAFSIQFQTQTDTVEL
jgi:hypothetical protein